MFRTIDQPRREAGVGMPAMRSLVAVFMGVLASGFAAGQEPPMRQPLTRGVDTLELSSLGFERILNTFMWTGGLFYSKPAAGLDLTFRQTLRSRLIRTEQRSIQDEYVTGIGVGIPVAKRWKVRAELSSSVLSDSRAVDLNKLAQHQGLLGVELTPSRNVSVGILGGYEFDAQQKERDEGPLYLIETRGRDVMVEEFRASFSSRWMQASLSPRRPESGTLEVRVERDFGTAARNLIQIAYNRQRREFYTAADDAIRRLHQVESNIFRRSAETFEVANQLDYRTGEAVHVTLRAGILNRSIDRGLKYKNFADPASLLLDTRIQEMQLFASFATLYRLASWLESDITVAYHEREERHRVIEEGGAPLSAIERQERAERRLENVARRTTAGLQLRSRPIARTRLNFAGSASILRYDTPDTLNIDDRDELLITLGVQAIHELRPGLTVALNAEGTLGHLVYLKRLQSANNNWNRIIRLAPAVDYVPTRWLRTTNRAEVLANYTVYDFEEQSGVTRSFSFRQASWVDSTSVQLTRLLDFEFVGGVRIYERGMLLWREFKERPQDFFVEQSLWPRLTYAAGSALQVGIGYRFFRQERYRYQAAKRVLERTLDTSGPTVALEWDGGHAQRFRLEGWRETQSQDGRVTRTIPNLSLIVSIAL